MRYAAGTFIFDERGRVLLMREGYGGRRWSVPGGAVEPGESPVDAAAREAMEEVGVEVRITGLVGLIVLRWSRLTIAAFVGDVFSGEPHIAAPEEVAEVAWFEPDDVRDPRSSTVRLLLDAAVRGERGLVVAEERPPD